MDASGHGSPTCMAACILALRGCLFNLEETIGLLDEVTMTAPREDSCRIRCLTAEMAAQTPYQTTL
jgi:hypothetical protein